MKYYLLCPRALLHEGNDRNKLRDLYKPINMANPTFDEKNIDC